MVRKNPNVIHLYLDKVERKKLLQLKELTPEYSDLDIDQIAHLELKETLFQRAREILKNPEKKSSTTLRLSSIFNFLPSLIGSFINTTLVKAKAQLSYALREKEVIYNSD